MSLKKNSIKTLSDFYHNMNLLHTTRLSMLNCILNSRSMLIKDLKTVEKIREKLKDLPQKDGKYILKTEQGQDITIELEYELSELKKDNIFIKQGHFALKDYLEQNHRKFSIQTEEGLDFLKIYKFSHFITDRDGTISNYCGRYLSSIQPIYNALALSEFSKAVEGHSIVLTSAPLLNKGLLDVSIQPNDEFVLSGSKGREIIVDGHKITYPLSDIEKDKINLLFKEIDNLLKDNRYSVFKYIGSGFQFKFGEITLARQDKTHSVSSKHSIEIKERIEDVIRKIDPDNLFFELDDTGYDLEIMLKKQTSEKSLKAFDKGDGLRFIFEQLNTSIKNKTILICGDTASDLPMIKAAQAVGANVVSIFVTKDQGLKNAVREICKQCYFADTPDILINILFQYSLNQKKSSLLNLFLPFIN